MVLGFSDNLNCVIVGHTVVLEPARLLKKTLFCFISAIGCDVFRTTNAMDWMLGILWIMILPSLQYYIQISFDI